MLKNITGISISCIATVALTIVAILGICLWVGYGHQLNDRYGGYFARAKSAGSATEMRANLQLVANNLKTDGYSSGELGVAFKNKGNDAGLILANLTNTIARLKQVENSPGSASYQLAMEDARTNLTSDSFPDIVSRIQWHQRWWAITLIFPIGAVLGIIALLTLAVLLDDYSCNTTIAEYKEERKRYKSGLKVA